MEWRRDGHAYRYHMKDKRDNAYEKIQEELDIPIAEIKNKIIGLRSQLSREVAKTKSRFGDAELEAQRPVCLASGKKSNC